MVTKRQQLRDAVHEVYSRISQRPGDEHPFVVGRRLAEDLGYPEDLLDSLPLACLESFCGVSNVAAIAEIPTGKVLGVDFSDAMLERACRGAKESGLENVCFCRADAENLPVGDGQLDVALVNGIFNLNPARDLIFRELARVVRPGGSVFASEIILKEPLPPEVQESEIQWFT